MIIEVKVDVVWRDWIGFIYTHTDGQIYTLEFPLTKENSHLKIGDYLSLEIQFPKVG